ncbi:MAG TPA: UDP-3-O-acyl-N-acetylglucosamine deacetylase [Chlamydiales bacterium]|nr:UDP-3-O-acyl-N-acetylglucosamine deacetylase [Chlamydiales bacterium]
MCRHANAAKNQFWIWYYLCCLIHCLEMQKTLKRPISISGKGLFSGEQSSITILPAPVNTGIIFQRIDLPGTPEIPALLEFVQDSSRCTRLGVGQASVLMVEHLLSSLYAYEIDNVRILVSGPEIPSCDGSAKLFAECIENIGIEIQDQQASVLTIENPVFYSRRDVHLVVIPNQGFKISYTLHYPQSDLIKSQFYSFDVIAEKYREEIAPCRTFSLYEEILPFIQSGVINGGGLENALVIQGDKILNLEGARFPNEMVRHKVLDLIGDLSLLGKRLCGHVIAICSGHASNVAFAKKISSYSEGGINV